MSHLETFIKLAAYLLCIGIALEISHRLYWRLNELVISANVSTAARALLSMLTALIPLATTFGVTWTFISVVDQKSLVTLGLAYDGDSMTKVAFGAAIAFGCVTLALLIGLSLGYIVMHRSRMSDDCVSCMPLFFGGLVDFFSGAIFEEIIFRGYIYILLAQSWGTWPAVFGSALIFSFAHVIKHNKTTNIYLINSFIFGVLAAMARNITGTLWLPIGLHFGWNVVSGPIFGLPYSGKSYDRGVVQSEVYGPEWLTGGMYSLDAGILGTVALMIAAVGLTAVAPIH